MSDAPISDEPFRTELTGLIVSIMRATKGWEYNHHKSLVTSLLATLMHNTPPQYRLTMIADVMLNAEMGMQSGTGFHVDDAPKPN